MVKIIEQSQSILEWYANSLQQYWWIQSGKERKFLIVFDEMITDMISNTKLHPVVTKLFRKVLKLNISLVFLTQSYFLVPKDVRLSTIHFFMMNIPNRKELQEIGYYHSSDIDLKDFMRIYKKCTAEPYSFLVIDTTLPQDNSLRFWENLLQWI